MSQFYTNRYFYLVEKFGKQTKSFKSKIIEFKKSISFETVPFLKESFKKGPPILVRILVKFSLGEMGGLLVKSKKSW